MKRTGIPKKYPRECATKICRGMVHNEAEHSPFCSKCRSRRWNAKNPLRVAFKSLRGHAKERGIDFSLTFEEYKTFAEQTKYLERRGKTSLSLSVDRKNNGFGYHAWNIQVLTLRENTRKQYVPYFRDFKESTMEDTLNQIIRAYP